MQLTKEQISAIQKELNYAVKYQETYDEVYDHIMTVIDGMPDSVIYPETLVREIVDEEFGGYENLKAVEKSSTKLAFKAMRQKHGQNIAYFFNWPVIIFTTAITITGYFITSNPANYRYLRFFITACAIAPVLFTLGKTIVGKVNGWFKNTYNKSSIKEGYVLNAAILSTSLINLFNAVFDKSVMMNGGVLLFVFVFYTIYVLSFFRLYSQEIKMEIAR